jgi:hypothetical protein
LELAQDDKILCDNANSTEDPLFIAHRHDQSIFSLLCKKHRISPHRDPSQYGDYNYFYKNIPYINVNGKKRFISYKPYPNSTYPRILLSQRRDRGFNLALFKLKIIKKDVLLNIKKSVDNYVCY